MEKKLPNRRSIRLKEYDYSQEGLYFITICTEKHVDLFGKIINDKMIMNSAGNIVKKVWDQIPQYYENIDIFDFVIMPDHIHGIIEIVGAGSHTCPENEKGQQWDVAPTEKKLTLADIVHNFKIKSTNEYIKGVKSGIYEPFNKRIWQRNYYERVVRNEHELTKIREYMMNNALKHELRQEKSI
jgi:putative transposase